MSVCVCSLLALCVSVFCVCESEREREIGRGRISANKVKRGIRRGLLILKGKDNIKAKFATYSVQSFKL